MFLCYMLSKLNSGEVRISISIEIYATYICTPVRKNCEIKRHTHRDCVAIYFSDPTMKIYFHEMTKLMVDFVFLTA
jgi:hypothetical protein